MKRLPLKWRKQLWFNAARFRHDDVIALSSLSNLWGGSELFTSSAMAPRTLLALRNFCLAYPNANVLEFGSGLSTLMLANLERQFSLGLKVTSVEESAPFADHIASCCADLREFNICSAPLRTARSPQEDDGPSMWYGLDLEVREPINLLIVDGPASRTSGRGQERFPALKFVESHLAKQCMIVLDDVSRPGEYAVAQRWRVQLGAEFTCCSDGRAVYLHRNLNVIPFVGATLLLPT